MTRLSALAAITTIASSDILHVASDPGGTNLDKKITFANFKLALLEGGIVVNEGGADADFRIEGDTDANLVFVDASTDRVGIGTPSPATKFHITIEDAVTNTVTNVLTVNHNSSSTPAANFGTGILFQGESDSTADSSMGRIRAYWHSPTHASRKGGMILSVYDTSTEIDVIRMLTNGGSTGYVGIMTPPNSSYVLDVLTNARIVGSNPALYLYDTIQGDNKRVIVQMDATNNLGVIQTTYSTGSAFPLVVKIVNDEVARFANTGSQLVVSDATTNGVTNALTLAHNTSSGAGAAGLGTGIAFNGETSTTADTLMGRVRSEWIVATHASRQSKLVLSAVYSGGEIFVAEFASTSSGYPQIGLGTNITAGYFLHVSNSLSSIGGMRIATTSNSTDLTAISVSAVYNGTSGNSYGIQSTLYDQGTTGVLLAAAQNTLVKNNVASALATGVATDSVIQVAGASSGNITAGIAVRARFILGGAGSVPTAYGFQLTAPSISSTGTITTLYGIHMAASQITGVTTFYSILTNDGLVVFNESGHVDADVRIEGDTDANLFFTDAGNDRVGIGMNNPAQKLDVTGNVKFGAASGAAGSRIIARGEHTSAPAGTLSAGEWELSVYDDGASPVFRIRYNDGGVEKTGNVTLA